MTKPTPLTAVIAITPDGVIGLDGGMPWQLSSDLRRFKRSTMGGALIMGRKTFESIGRPLPGRQTIVVTRNPDWRFDGVMTAENIDSAIATINREQAFVVGGAEIYRLFQPAIDRWLITRVWSSVIGDTTLELDLSDFQCELITQHPAGPKDSVPTQFEVWTRKKSDGGA